MQLTQTHQSNPDYLRLYDGNSEEAILLGTLFWKNMCVKFFIFSKKVMWSNLNSLKNPVAEKFYHPLPHELIADPLK